MAEPQTAAAQVGSAEDSDDDEYVYVSSLAERIAGALMLDEDEEPPALQYVNQPSAARSLQQELWSKDTTWPGMCTHKDIQLESKIAASMLPVPCVAAARREHGPTEWGHFYMPSSQQASRQLSHLYTMQLERRFSKQRHLSQGWDFSRLVGNEQAAAAGLQEMWNLHHQETHLAEVSDRAPPMIRKQSAGTGVFLPNMANSSLHYRRKSGFSSAKPAYGPRHRC